MFNVLKNIASAITLTIFIFLLFEKNVGAYLDPGTGSMILQAVIGAIVGSAVAIKIFWKRIKYFFLRLIGKAKEAE